MARILGNASEDQNTTTHPSLTNYQESPCILHVCRYSVGEKVAIVLSLAIVFLVILCGNSLLCYLIFKERKLRRSSTWFSIVSLAISDMMVAVFCMPVLVVQIYTLESWPFGETICRGVPFILNVAWVAAIINLTIISTEKFLAVCCPFKCYWKSYFVKVGIVLGWLVAIVDAGYYTGMAEKKVVALYGKKYCIESWNLEENKHFLIMNIVLFYFVPLAIIFVLHTAITIKLKSKSSQPLHEPIGNTQQVNLSKHRHRTEAVKALLMIALSFAVFMTPFEVYNLIQLVNPQLLDRNTAFHLFTVTLWLFFFNLATHPFIYGLLSKKYKLALRREVSFLSRKSSMTRSVKSPQVKFHRSERAAFMNNT